jgi:hypothetical protein
MAIDRTAYNALVDDDGSNLVGTPWTKNIVKTVVLDPIDARWAETTTTATGTQDNLAYSEADVLRCNNATALTLRGLLAPAAPLKPGKALLVVAVGAGTVTLNDQDTNSTAANRIVTGTAAPITLAAGTGFAWLEYDSVTARWRVVGSSVSSAGTVTQTTTVVGSQNDFALTAGTTLLRCNNATLLTLTGLAAGVDDQRLDLIALGAGGVTLTDQDAGSVAANRIITGTGAPLVLAAGLGLARLVYDATTARWRVTGSSVAAAAGVTGAVQGSAFHNTTQALANATFTALNFNSEDYQVGALHSTSVNNSRITIATTGKYLFIATVCFVPNATGQRIIVGKINGTTFFDKLDFPTNGTQTFEAQLSKLIALTAGDYVEIFAFQDSGGSLNVGDATNRYSQNAVAWIRMT